MKNVGTKGWGGGGAISSTSLQVCVLLMLSMASWGRGGASWGEGGVSCV